MNLKNIIKQFSIGIFPILILFGCNNPNNESDVAYQIEGPFYKEAIMELFNLDSLRFNVDSKDLYLVKLKNISNEIVSIEHSNQNEIFPDSTWYHSFVPFSAENRKWSRMIQGKPKADKLKSELHQGESKHFWFSSYYDYYVDSVAIFFNYTKGNKTFLRIINQHYDKIDKPIIDYTLIEVESSKEFTKESQIEVTVNGPMFYKMANSILGVNIPFGIDSEEVFIFDIKNNRKDSLYIETWENNEINIDTIYSYSPFTLTSKEDMWIQGTTGKGGNPDTIIIKPNESRKFWDSHSQMRPNTDSIGFINTYITDNYLITGMKGFEVKKSIKVK